MTHTPQEKLAAVIAEMRDEAFECRTEDASAGIFPDHEAADRLTGWADTLTTLLSEHGGGGEAVAGELLPCPFCGAHASRWDYDTSRGNVFGVCCSNDGCPADVYAEGDSREAADAAWNRRTTTPTPSAPVVDEMRTALLWYAEQAELCRKLGREGDAGRHALDADAGKRARAALSGVSANVGVDEAMVERALRHQAFQEDGAQWPDAYGEEEQKYERERMCGLLTAAHDGSGPSAYCRACQASGMSNCQHFDECDGATCITCHRPLNAALSGVSAPVGVGKITLTAAEITDLAEFTGLRVDCPDDIDPDTEIDLYPCPPEGVRYEGEPSDPDSRSYYRYIAVLTDYPEEGCVGLGNEIDPPLTPAAAPRVEHGIADHGIDRAAKEVLVPCDCGCGSWNLTPAATSTCATTPASCSTATAAG